MRGELPHPGEQGGRHLRRLASLVEHGEHGDAEEVAPLILEVNRAPRLESRGDSVLLQSLDIRPLAPAVVADALDERLNLG